MKIKSIFFFAIFVILFGCNQIQKTENANVTADSVDQYVHPNTKTFYQTKTDDQSIVVADSIIYDVIIQNSQYGNDWTNECSYYTSAEAVDVEAITNMIFQAIYNKRLIPYDLFSNETMTIEQVKDLETKYKRETISKMEFNEEWYFNENTLEMSKLIKEISFGFEKVDKDGIVLSYYPAFKVYLNNQEKNTITK